MGRPSINNSLPIGFECPKYFSFIDSDITVVLISLKLAEPDVNSKSNASKIVESAIKKVFSLKCFSLYSINIEGFWKLKRRKQVSISSG